MELQLKREWFSGKSTIGELSIDGELFCFTLEDCERTLKVYGVTAIPCGTYQVVITPSKRFGRLMPLLVNVPGFSGIRIHPGNTADDTEGCLLVGKSRSQDFIGKSREAFNELFIRLVDAKTPITITIEDAP